MLVESPDGQRALLGRSRKFAPGMYTCLSGFMEQCESIEEVRCCHTHTDKHRHTHTQTRVKEDERAHSSPGVGKPWAEVGYKVCVLRRLCVVRCARRRVCL